MAVPACAPSALAESLFDLPYSPLISSDQADWDNVQLALFDQPPHCIREHVAPYHVVCINAGAPVMLEQTIDGKSQTASSVAGDIGIYPAHLWQTFQWHQDAKFLQLYIEPALLNDIGTALYQKASIELLPQSLPGDPMISQIAIALQNILTTGSAGSKLYADTLATTLATHLLYTYSSHQPSLPKQAGQLSPHQLEQVTDYIDEHLAKDLSLVELATIVQVSPFHFARLFKRSTGIAPHQYHIHCRIKRTKSLLLERKLTIAQIAQTVGFSSQSHLNYHFKRIVRLTPTAFLRQ
ncbi:MAG: AraC family transcriptional regulator [Phormidesmis sp.]